MSLFYSLFKSFVTSFEWGKDLTGDLKVLQSTETSRDSTGDVAKHDSHV